MSGKIQIGHEEEVLHRGGGWSLEQAPREVDVAPSLSEFKEYLDDALHHMI